VDNSLIKVKIAQMLLKPARRIHGRVSVPGDKSISHRAAMISALAAGESQILNFATSADCASTLSCLSLLGVPIVREGATLRIQGAEHGNFKKPSAALDCGNSGSTMRMLAGLLAAQDFTSTMTGDASLRSRPMARVIEPLHQMGAHITSAGSKPPLTISGTSDLKSTRYLLPIASAQVKSCVLLAGMLAQGTTEVIETVATRDHTERMLNWFGVPVETTTAGDSHRITVSGRSLPSARRVSVPGDISSAAFLIAAASLISDSELEFTNVGLNPTRTQFLSTFQSLGLNLRIDQGRDQCNEPVGSIFVNGNRRSSSNQDQETNLLPEDLIPQLIDELPLLAVVGTQVAGGISIRGAQELRLKESDRIKATVANLKSMGAVVEEARDGMSVPGPQKLRGAKLNSYGDHRIAMAFTVAALVADGESELLGSDCVAVSYPEFFQTLESIVEY
jgi:3-phosphoshikimate 1-carboxyvinyltransferase